MAKWKIFVYQSIDFQCFHVLVTLHMFLTFKICCQNNKSAIGT